MFGALEGLREGGASSRSSARAHIPSNWWIAVFAAVAFGAAAFVGWRLREHEGPAGAGATPSASAQTDGGHKGIAMTDHPPPKTNVPEAALAYAKALQDLRDASLGLGQQGLAHAVALDSGLAAAHLRIALFASSPSADAAGSYRAARQLRAQLDERDQLLLRAAEELDARSPRDVGACEARLTEAAQRFPDDAEILFHLANVEIQLDHKLDDALAAATREAALDPASAAAVWHLGKVRMMKGDAAGALLAAKRCLDLAPSATSCVRIESTVHMAEDDCPAMLANARRQVALEPNGRAERGNLREALGAMGAPVEALVEADAQVVAATDPKDRPKTEATLAFNTAFLAGDFDAAARHLDDLARANAAAPVPGAPVTPVEPWLVLLSETGDTRRASAIARDFMRRLPSYDRRALLGEELLAVQTLLATGEMTRQEAARVRSEQDALAPDLVVPRPHARLLVASVRALTTEDEPTLREILTTYAEPLPAFDLADRLEDVWAPFVECGLGKALVLTGDLARGAQLLDQASRTCAMSGDQDTMAAFVHGLYWLGFGREKQGDTPGACEAYTRVLGYWGHAKPRSVTADEARARQKALGCRN